MIYVGRRHGVPDRLERFQATLDPGVKTSSRLHHAHCGAARCDRVAANRRYAGSGSCLLATMWTQLSGGPAIVGAGQTVCLENRQHVAACEQVFSSDRSARGRPSPKAFGNQRLIRLARIVLRSMASAASFRRSLQVGVPRTCKVHAMIASRSRLGVRAPSHHKTSYQRRLGRIAHKHLHTIGSLARRRVPLRLRPIPMQQPSQRGE